MGRVFQPARFGGATAPLVQSMQYDSAEDFLKGAVMIQEGGSTGEIIEASDYPTAATIVGVALEPDGSKPGYNVANSDQVQQTTGRVQEVSVARANRVTVFTGRMIDSTHDPLTPVLSDIFKSFGVKAVSGEWVIDHDVTASAAVKIVDIDIDNNFVFFKFLEAVLGTP